jgi:Pyruvate/2-oxoacid:ferredoxin oxidoreductase delta subunit/Pyruvate/2-oxoacid:ferredoxin oxidoreductase gamma subunit
MPSEIDIKQSVHDYFVENDIYEYPCFCIARQGGRTALEILTRALVMEGKFAYLGQNLTGLRSMGSNSMVVRFAETPEIPPGISVNNPRGALFMHEALIKPKQGLAGLISQLNRVSVMKQLKGGILMVCTSKTPEELSALYPFPFKGTVATIDAEAIFARRVGIQPAPSGITALGLFVAATGNQVSIEAVKESIMAHERLDRKIREQNLGCLVEAYEAAEVIPDMTIEGFETGESNEMDDMFRKMFENQDWDMKDLEEVVKHVRSLSSRWRRTLPVCDTSKCVCAECLPAYFCPEAAISWQDDSINFDYQVCKACGTCVAECVHDAITLKDAAEVADAQKK